MELLICAVVQTCMSENIIGQDGMSPGAIFIFFHYLPDLLMGCEDEIILTKNMTMM